MRNGAAPQNDRRSENRLIPVSKKGMRNAVKAANNEHSELIAIFRIEAVLRNRDKTGDKSMRIAPSEDKRLLQKHRMPVTVEEKIVAMQARKKALVAGLLDDQQAEKLQLTADDLEVLFAPLP
jgi:hypothetical protein